MRTLGIDLASQPENTALCVVSWADDGRGAEVEPPRAGCDDDALLAEMARADAVGIDAPFGWPAAFVSAVAGEGWPAGVAVDALRFRETDRFVRSWTGEVLGRRLSPLSVSADRIAYCAWRCRSLLARHRGTSRVYEVYPAAALAVWGQPHRGYKRTTGDGPRACTRTLGVRPQACATRACVRSPGRCCR